MYAAPQMFAPHMPPPHGLGAPYGDMPPGVAPHHAPPPPPHEAPCVGPPLPLASLGSAEHIAQRAAQA
eukprot:7136592-Prymnesium_polylepis.1